MKKYIINLVIAAAVPMSLGIAQTAHAAADDSSVVETAPSAQQYDSPVASTSVSSKQTRATTTHAAEKQMPRHPAGAHRHAGAVAASSTQSTY